MSKFNCIIILIFITSFNISGQNKVRIYGHVTDFNNKPIDSVTVRLKQKIDSLKIEDKADIFKNSYETLTDSNGYFSINVDPATYYCVYAIKEKDYGKSKLEYWAWNVPIYNDLEINPQYDRMEIYGINGFEPQHGPFDSYIIYFRPMSLTKGQDFKKRNISSDTIAIAPNSIDQEELTMKINGIPAKVVSINKIRVYTQNGHYMYAYMAQMLKPIDNKERVSASELVEGFDKITVILHSKETNELGKAEYFLKRIGN